MTNDMDNTATATATESLAAASFNVKSLATAMLSDSAEHQLITDVIGGFRTVTDSPAAIAAAIIDKATEIADKARTVGFRPACESIAVLIGGKGLTTVAGLALGVDLPAAGDLGYTVSRVEVRGIETPEGKKNGSLGLSVYPCWSAAAFMATDEGRAMVDKIVQKECGLVAFRPIRVVLGETTYEELDQGAIRMPLTVGDYTDTSRGPSESFACFNDNWPKWMPLALKIPARAPIIAALPKSKPELLKAIRSKAYALAMFPALESRDLFAKVATAFANEMGTFLASDAAESGKPLAYDMTAVLRWIEGRDTLDLRPQVEATDLEALDLSGFGV
jgi:hypothetical protein